MVASPSTLTRCGERRTDRSPDAALLVDQIGVVTSTVAGPAGRWVARFLGLRPCVPARLRIVAIDPDDPTSPTRWHRTFGSTTTITTMTVAPNADVVERVGPLTLRFETDVDTIAHADTEAHTATGGLRLELAAVRLGPIDVSDRLPLSITIDVTDDGIERMTTVNIDAGRLGRARYVATMRDHDRIGDAR